MLGASQPDRAWRRTGAWPPAALLIPLISSFSTCPDWTRIPCGCDSLLLHRQVSSFESLLHGSMDVFPTSMLCCLNTRIWEPRAFSKCGILSGQLCSDHSYFSRSPGCVCAYMAASHFLCLLCPSLVPPLTLPRKSRMARKIFWYAKNLEGNLTGLVP